jgi:two-component system phosphate regulon sensor histidine kinase PhoR
VRSVTEGARRLAGGDLDHRVHASASDETLELADAFNRMADSFKEVIHNLSSERNTLSAVLDTMADGVIMTETTGKVLLLNQAARDLLGLGKQNTDNARLIELVRDYSIHQLVLKCLVDKARLQTEVELLYPRRFLSAIATPLAEPTARGVLLTLHDLTRIRQVETSQKEFVANVSHELRNPLASIKAMVETLEFGALADATVAADYLGRMHRDVDRINSLVNDLLELSRLESGQFTIRAEPTALAPLVHSVQNQFKEPAAARKVTIEDTIPEDLPLLLADSDKLSQVLVNLVENALKFTPPKGRVSIKARPLNGNVEIELKDTGPGIAPQHLPHLFERFYKVDRARRDGGTGLGLAIVKQVVEAHGGQVRVESSEGLGSTFTFTIPQAK